MKELRRIGHFRIPRDIIDHEPQMARDAMRDVIIVRCEMLYYENILDYYALSDHFEEVPEYCLAPDYRAIFEKDANGKGRFVRWEKE